MAAPRRERIAADAGGRCWQRSTWPRVTCHHAPMMKMARSRLCISDVGHYHLRAIVRGRQVVPATRHRPKNLSHLSASTNRGDICWTQPQPPGHTRRAPQMPGPECGRRVPHDGGGQVVEVAAASASAPGPDGRYQIPVKVQGGMHRRCWIQGVVRP